MVDEGEWFFDFSLGQLVMLTVAVMMFTMLGVLLHG